MKRENMNKIGFEFDQSVDPEKDKIVVTINGNSVYFKTFSLIHKHVHQILDEGEMSIDDMNKGSAFDLDEEDDEFSDDVQNKLVEVKQ